MPGCLIRRNPSQQAYTQRSCLAYSSREHSLVSTSMVAEVPTGSLHDHANCQLPVAKAGHAMQRMCLPAGASQQACPHSIQSTRDLVQSSSKSQAGAPDMQRTLSAAECSTSGRPWQTAARSAPLHPAHRRQPCPACSLLQAAGFAQTNMRGDLVQAQAAAVAEYGQDLSVAADSYIVLVSCELLGQQLT